MTVNANQTNVLQIQYAARYVWLATSARHNEPPDPARSGEYAELLTSLFEINQESGYETALKAWAVLKKSYPELKHRQRLYNFNELGHIKPPAYILPDDPNGTAPTYAIYKEGLNLLYGKPGSGKSFVGIDIACRTAAAYPDRAVIYAAGEGRSGLQGRYLAWCKHHKVQLNNLYLWDSALQFQNADEVNQFMSEVTPLHPSLLIVDTLARSMIGLNENDTAIMGLFIQSVERLADETRMGILFVHHLNKLGQMRGSTALEGALDSILRLDRDESRITIFNALDKGGKNKHREEAEPLYFTLAEVELIAGGTTRKEAVLVPAERQQEASAEKLSKNQRAVLEVLQAYENGVPAQIIIETTTLPRRTVYNNLSKLMTSRLARNDDMERYFITPAGLEALNTKKEG